MCSQPVVHCLWGIDTISSLSSVTLARCTLPMRNWHMFAITIAPTIGTSCTLPMRNWHHLCNTLFPYILRVVHCLWGIDTFNSSSCCKIFYALYIAYEELTQALIWKNLNIKVVHCLWGIDTFLHTLFFPRGEKNL